MLDHLPLSRAIKLYQIFPKNLHVDSEQWLFCNDTCFQADIIQKQMADDDAHKMKDKNEASGVNVLQICGFFKPSKHIWKEDDSFAWPLESSCFKEAVDRSKPIQPYGQLEESYEQVQEIHALQEKSRGMIRSFSALEIAKLIHGVLGHVGPLRCNTSHWDRDDSGLMSSMKPSRRLQVDRAPSIKLRGGDGVQGDEADSHSISVQPSCLCGKLFSGYVEGMWKMWKSVMYNRIHCISMSCSVLQCTLVSTNTMARPYLHKRILHYTQSQSLNWKAK